MDQDLIRIGDHVDVMRRRWRILAAMLTLGLACGLLLTFLQPVLYRGEVRLLLEPGSATTSGAQVMSAEEVATQADVVDSLPVATRVVDRLGLDTQPSDLVDEVTVEVVDNKRVLAVTALDADPERAASVANAFAEEYIEFRQERSSTAQEEVRETYAQDLEEIQQRLAEIQVEVTQASDQGDVTQLRLEEQSLTQRKNDVSLALLNLDAEAAGQQAGGDVLIEASPASSPFQPRPLRSAVLGGVLGLLLGFGLAYARDRQDDGIRDEDRMLAALGGRPILGRIPESKEEASGRVSTLLAPWSPASEAFRTLNSNLRFLAATEGEGSRAAKIVLVSSAQPGEGKTAVSTNLAVTAARAGIDVILVDADLRDPNMAQRFGMDLPIGLSDLLVSDIDARPHLHTVGHPNLRILAAGTVPPNPSELLASPRSRSILEELSSDCDLVIVDSAPLNRVADSLELVRSSDLILLVAKQGTSRLREYTAAMQRIRQVGGHVAGGVLNGVAGKAVTYGYGATPETPADRPAQVPVAVQRR